MRLGGIGRLWGRLVTCGGLLIRLPENAMSVRMRRCCFVGQPILAAAGFQPALFASRCEGFCRKRCSRQGSSVAQGRRPVKFHRKTMPKVWHALAWQPAGRPGFFDPVAPVNASSPLLAPAFLSGNVRALPLLARIARPNFSHSHERQTNPTGHISSGRNRHIAVRREPAKSRLQPGLAAPQSALESASGPRFLRSVNAARRSACATNGVS